MHGTTLKITIKMHNEGFITHTLNLCGEFLDYLGKCQLLKDSAT